MVSKLKGEGMDSRVLFVNAVMETTSKGQKPTNDWIMNAALAKGMEFPQVNDSDRKLRKFFSCNGLPMNMAVDLKSMKIVYNKCGYSESAMDSFLKSHFGS